MWVILITGIIQLYYIYSTWSYNTCLIIKWKFIPNKKKRYRTIIISSVTDILIIHPFVFKGFEGVLYSLQNVFISYIIVFKE